MSTTPLERLVQGIVVETGPDFMVRRAVATGAAATDGFIIPEALVGAPVWAVLGPAATTRIQSFTALLGARAPFTGFDFALVSREKGVRHFRASGEPVCDHGIFGGYVILVADVSNQVAQANARARAQRITAAVAENCPALIVLKDVEGRYISINRTAAEIYGVTPEEAAGRQPEDVLTPGLAAACRLLDDEVLESEAVRETEQVFGTGEGRSTFLTQKFPLHDTDGCLIGTGAVGADISELKFASERLYHQSHFDEVTDLPKRALAMDRLGQVLVSARRKETNAGVAVLQIANFSALAGAFGHRKGDGFIHEVANRLRKSMRESDTIARLSEDTFCIVLSEIAAEDDLAVIAAKIEKAMALPVAVAGNEIRLKTSIGFSLYPADAAVPESLVQFAELAMRQAIRESGRPYCRFAAGMDEESRRRQQVESALTDALARGELAVVYQPVVDLMTGCISSAEALVRWKHPVLGQVPPDVFIPLAEQAGLIGLIGDWVMSQAVRAAAAWSPAIGVAVNVSTRQLSDPALVARVAALLENTGLAPHRLKLEVTESALAEDMVGARATLDALRALGVVLCLDDFGTGYSALSYLATYSFDILKIDRSFVRDVAGNRLSASLADSIIRMARRLGIKVVAEGVEDKRQLAFLKRRGCDFVQGYYFSKPLSESDIQAFIARSLTSLAA